MLNTMMSVMAMITGLPCWCISRRVTVLFVVFFFLFFTYFLQRYYSILSGCFFHQQYKLIVPYTYINLCAWGVNCRYMLGLLHIPLSLQAVFAQTTGQSDLIFPLKEISMRSTFKCHLVLHRKEKDRGDVKGFTYQ